MLKQGPRVLAKRPGHAIGSGTIPEEVHRMRSVYRITALLLLAVTTLSCANEKKSADGKRSADGRAGADSDWRPLPLIKNGQIDPAWKQVGWGGFVVEDGILRTAP